MDTRWEAYDNEASFFKTLISIGDDWQYRYTQQWVTVKDDNWVGAICWQDSNKVLNVTETFNHETGKQRARQQAVQMYFERFDEILVHILSNMREIKHNPRGLYSYHGHSIVLDTEYTLLMSYVDSAVYRAVTTINLSEGAIELMERRTSGYTDFKIASVMEHEGQLSPIGMKDVSLHTFRDALSATVRFHKTTSGHFMM